MNTCVVGLQWGDEGKGKIVDIFAEQHDIVVRYGGGKNAGQSPWLGSWPVVFNKLAKYFDADVYAGSYLGDGILPPEGIWGLAECTNYQFLS